MYMPEASSSRLAYTSRTDRKGKGKAQGQEKEKVKGKWEVGTKGWVKEGFRKFGEHCARNQVCLPIILKEGLMSLWYDRSEHF